jgi:hypothetical protein
MSDHYQDAIYQRFKARFPDYRVKIAWNDMKQGWVVDVIGERNIVVTALVVDDPQLFTKEPEPYHKAVMVLARMPDWKPELTEYGKRNVDDLVRFAYQEMQECLGES